MRFLHTADLHIGKQLKAYGPEVEEKLGRALIAVLRDILALAAAEKIDLVLIPGDFIEQQEITNREEREVIGILGEPRDFDIVFAAGNHDPYTVGDFYSKLEGIPRLHVLSPESMQCLEFPELDTVIYGKSFGEVYQREPIDFTLCDSAMTNRIGVIHGDLTRPAETSLYSAVTTDAVRASGLHYLALGHIHKPSERDGAGQYERVGKTVAVYPGSPQGLSFNEAGDRHVVIGELERGIWKSLEPVAVGKFNFYEESVAVDGIDGTGDIADAVFAALAERHGPDFGRHIYRITLMGEQDSPLPMAAVTEQLRQADVFEVPPVRLYDETYIACDIGELSRESGLIGEFVREYEKRIASGNADREALDRALDLAIKSFSERRTIC